MVAGQTLKALPVLAAVAAVACGAPSGTLTVAGTAEMREVRLSPLAGGRLVRLLKDEGDSVTTGDTVAVLEQPGLQELIRQRRAQVAAVESRLSEIAAAQADSARAANDLERARRLLAGGSLSQQQFDAAVTASAVATARLQGVRAGPAEVRAAEAALGAARATLDQLTLIAPEDGVVLTRFAERGEAVAAGTPVVSIGVTRQLWIRAYVGEPFIARVRLGAEARVRVDGYPDTVFLGRVTEIASRAEFTPRAALTERERADLVFGIKITLDDAGNRIKAGMPVEVDLTLPP